MLGASESAGRRLIELADDADRRQWLGYALEARLAAVLLLEQQGDATAFKQREHLESAAREHGFRWLLARLTSAPKR